MKYDYKTNEIKDFLTDKLFIRRYKQLEFGYYYGINEPLGLFSLHENNGIEFHFLNIKNSNKPICRFDALNDLIKAKTISKELHLDFENMKFKFFDIKGDGKKHMVCRHAQGLSVYEFVKIENLGKPYMNPIKLFDVSISFDETERFWFVCLTKSLNSSYFDLVTLKYDGLRVYKFNNNKNLYELINYSNYFSVENGWTLEHTKTIMFCDYNQSGYAKLIYTGKNGFKIDKILQVSNSQFWEWVNLIDFEFNSNLNEKFMIPIEIISSSKSPIRKAVIIGDDIIENKPIFLEIDNDEKIYENSFVDIEDSEKYLPNFVTSNNQSTIETCTECDKNEKVVLNLSESIDIKSLIASAVNGTNGTVNLSLPLIKVGYLKESLLTINYRSLNLSSENILGEGWDIPKEFIFVDFNSNTSRYAHKYFLVTKENGFAKLVYEKQDNSFMHFIVDGCNNLKVFYDFKKFIWNVSNSSDGFERVYGGCISPKNLSGNGIEWKLCWKNWLGNGKSNKNQRLLPVKWHLKSLKDESIGIRIEFNYTQIANLGSDNSNLGTKAIYLDKININDNETKVEFIYDGNDSKYLKKVKLETQFQIQTIMFNYAKNDFTRLLDSISQEETGKCILKFSYKNFKNSNKLEKIVFPDQKDSIKFIYEPHGSLASINSPFELLKDKLISCQYSYTDFKLACSIDYLILSHIAYSGSRLMVHIYDKINSTDNYESLELPITPDLLGYPIQKYQIVACNDFFLVYIFDDKAKKHSVFLCHRNKNRKWLIQMSKLIKDIKLFGYNNEFVTVLLNNKQLLIVEWNQKWYESFNTILNFKDSNDILMKLNEENTILIYDNTSFYVYYKSFKNKWMIKKILGKPNYINEIKEFSDSFDLDDNLKNEIIDYLKQNLLHYSHNIILVNRVFIKDDSINSCKQIFMTDSELDVTYEHEIVSKKPISSISISREDSFYEGEKIQYDLIYYRQNNKYIIGFKKNEVTVNFDVKNKTYKRIYSFDFNKINVKVKDHFNYDVKEGDQEVKLPSDNVKTWFLVNIHDFQVKLSNNVLVCGIKEKYEFDGSDWVPNKTKNDSKMRIEICKDLFLGIDDGTEDQFWKLYDKNDTTIFNFGVKDLNNIHIAYPAYIAYFIKESNSVWVLPIDNNSLKERIFVTKGDYIVSGSNQFLLAVKTQSSIKYFPNPGGLSNNQIDNFAVSNKILTIDNQDYIKKYEYDETSVIVRPNGIFFSKYKIYPGNSPEIYGHIENVIENNKVIIKYVNSENKVVKSEEIVEKSDTNDETEAMDVANKKMTRKFAKDSRTEIAEFYNLNVEEDEADFIGFESYESFEKWEFNKNECIRNNCALTGQSFLRLTSKITRKFSPTTNNCYYECSAWVRISTCFNLNQEFKEFKAIISETNEILYSNVVCKYQDWYYVRIIIALDKKQSIKIQLEASSNEKIIDIDHIKWAVLGYRLQISFYDEFTMQVCSSIKENNLIKYLIFDPFYQPLAVLNSNYQLKQFNFSYNNSKSIIKVEASNAIYEKFSDYSLVNFWFIEKAKNWKRCGNRLNHCSTIATSSLKLNREDLIINKHSIAIYFKLKLKSKTSRLIVKLGQHEITFTSNEILFNNILTSKTSASCHYFLLIEKNRLIVWINNKEKVLDNRFIEKNLSTESSPLTLVAYNLLTLSELLILNEPRIQVNHLNSVGNVRQSIQLEDDKTIVITERLYDELEREAVLTKPTRLSLSDTDQSLDFKNDLITNGSFLAVNSFWKTGKLAGLVSVHNPDDEGYCYFKSNFSNDSLSHVQFVDMPGKSFSNTKTKIENKKSINESYKYFEVLFPPENGFVSRTVMLPNGNRTMTFFDKNENRVAVFSHTLGFRDILTTYEYDDKNNLLRILPPLFHSEVYTLEQCGVTFKDLCDSWTSDVKITNLQNEFGTNYKYSESDLLIESHSPECGTQVFIYSKQNLLRFTLKLSKQKLPYRVEYLNYNKWGEVCEKGFSENPKYFDLKNLYLLADSYIGDLTDAIRLQIADIQSSIEYKFNGKLVLSEIKNTVNSSFSFKEEVCYISDENISKKQIVFENKDRNLLFRFEKTYFGHNLRSITYPLEYNGGILTVVYSYNLQGLVSSIGFGKENDNLEATNFVYFKYTPAANLSEETFYSQDSDKELFNRQYNYNSAGFIQKINDLFQEQTLYYNNDGYGQTKYYDGTISKIKIKPRWVENKCDPRPLKLNEEILIEKLACIKNVSIEEAEYLLEILVNEGYLDNHFKVIKQLTIWDGMIFLPLMYDELTILKLIDILNEYFPSQTYGYRYSYGSHLELVNAKYFVEDTSNNDPIKPNDFAVEGSITLEKSKFIWKMLVDERLIFSDTDPGCDETFGKININRWIDFESVQKCLNESGFSSAYVPKLVFTLQRFYAMKADLNEEDFSEKFKSWLINHNEKTTKQKEDYKKIGKELWKVLSNSNYFFNSTNKKCALFKKDFYDLFNKTGLINEMPFIIGVLCKKSSVQIGNSSCDLRSYEIDDNGNHRIFWKGYQDRYELIYLKNSNQVSQINHLNKSYQIEYDNLGNITKAGHKGIDKILYDPISNRALKFLLKNGSKVLFNYDSQAERIYKCVLDVHDHKTKEIFYLRDQKGRCLIEKIVLYDEHEQIISENMIGYIYGPRGLLGFIKNEEFYQILTDHEYSIRIVVKNMEIVAAFDYLPYGSLIRKYGVDAEEMRYRFTGKGTQIKILI